MEIHSLGIPGLMSIIPNISNNDIWSIQDIYNEEDFAKAGLPTRWVEDINIVSRARVLRGMYWQKSPYTQDKLIRIISGEAINYFVDIRLGSPDFGKYKGVYLHDKIAQIIFVPKGFAHGYLTMTDNTRIECMVSAPYNKKAQRAFAWNDPTVNIRWGIIPILSCEDANRPELRDIPTEDFIRYKDL